MKSSEIPLLNLRTLILVALVGGLLNSCSGGGGGTSAGGGTKAAADTAFRKGDYAVARADYAKALQSLDTSTPDGKRQAAALNYALGDTCKRMGKIDDAVKYHTEEVRIASEAGFPSPEDQVASLDALYGIFYKEGKFDDCEKVARAELAAADKYLKKDDPRVEHAVSNVLAVACRNGICQDETELFGRLYELRSAKLGPTAQATCAARQMLAEAWTHKRQYDKAAALYKENLDAYQKQAPNMVPDVSVVYARALLKAGKSKDALAAVSGISVTSGPDAVKLWALRGDAYDALGKQKEALDAYARMTKLGEATWGEKDQELANYMVRYAELLKKVGRKKEAAALDAKIEAVYKAPAKE